MENSVPFLDFSFTNSVIKPQIMTAFEEFFERKSYVLGTGVSEFEANYSKFNQVKHTVGVSNGLDALHICLRALGIGQGDEVIIPSNTFIATALAVSYTGAKTVFAEPSPLSYNIDPKNIASCISERTKAIIPVHLYGQACDMDSIIAVADKSKRIAVIEDNAQAHGAYWNGRPTGSWGAINATSFYPGKNLGALGDAGAITTNSEDLANVASKLRNYGSSRKYTHDLVGYNMRLDECQAIFLSIKLRHLMEWTRLRQKLAQMYCERLKDVGDITLPFTDSRATHVYHLFVVRTSRREALQEFLGKNGIGTLIHYPKPIHLQPAYSSLGYRKGSFPIAEQLSETVLSLPLWPGMLESQVDRVTTEIKRFFN